MLVGCYQPVLDPDPLQEAHIIDWHVHVAGLGYGGSGNFINEEMRNNYRFEFFSKTGWMRQRKNLKNMAIKFWLKNLMTK